MWLWKVPGEINAQRIYILSQPNHIYINRIRDSPNRMIFAVYAVLPVPITNARWCSCKLFLPNCCVLHTIILQSRSSFFNYTKIIEKRLSVSSLLCKYLQFRRLISFRTRCSAFYSNLLRVLLTLGHTQHTLNSYLCVLNYERLSSDLLKFAPVNRNWVFQVRRLKCLSFVNRFLIHKISLSKWIINKRPR